MDLARTSRATPPRGGTEIAGDAATLLVPGHLSLEVRRAPLSAVIASPTAVSDQAILHPLLSWLAAVAASWTGRCAFHGSAIVIDDRAWVLLGAPGAGKTSLAALLQADGLLVLADDLSIVDRGTVLAGPRAADLRRGAADHLGVGQELDEHIGRRRWRIPLSESPMEVPLGGFIELVWSDELTVDPLPAADRLEMLARHDALWLGPGRPRDFLELLALPCWRLRRPRGWQAAEGAVRAVREVAQRAAR